MIIGAYQNSSNCTLKIDAFYSMQIIANKEKHSGEKQLKGQLIACASGKREKDGEHCFGE